MSEAQEQMALFQWAEYKPELRWMYAIPNGGSRNKIEAVNLKRQGVKAGVSDICIPVARSGYHGMYIEMKVGRNKPTDKQKEFIEFASEQGYKCVVCYGAGEAIDQIEKYLRGEKWMNRF